MKYLIWAQDADKYRTITGWVKNESELFEGEKMLSFNNRQEADKIISRFKNCASYGITDKHPLYKYCN